MSLEKIEAYVTKYMTILGSKSARPKIVIRNSLVNWFGRTTFKIQSPETTLIEIQSSILGDDKTLERVVAHEIVHHDNMTNMTPSDHALIKMGLKPPGHGRDFLEGAKKINNVMGADFVTTKSDQTYVANAGTKSYTVLIEPALKRLGWSWAFKISDEAKEIIERKKREANAKVVITTDPRWATGPRIKKYAGVAIPALRSAEEKLLREMYEAA